MRALSHAYPFRPVVKTAVDQTTKPALKDPAAYDPTAATARHRWRGGQWLPNTPGAASSIRQAGELRALIRMHMNLGFGLAAPDGHEQGLQRQVGMRAALHRPAARQRFACKPREGANDTPRKQIDHDCQIQETPVRADISDIGDPKLVGGIHVELPVQRIVRHDSRTATIRARLLFITNLGPYARQSGQAPSPIGTDVFAEIAQIVMQLAVSLDLATLLPSCLDKHGLPLTLQRPLG